MPIIKDEKLRKKQSNYWHPIKGSWDRFKSSWENNTNPIKGALNLNLLSLIPGLNLLQTVYDADQTKENITNTYRSAKQGDYKATALYGGSVLLDLLGAKKAGNDLQERARAALYRNKNPFGYKNNIRSDKSTWQELGDATKEFLNFGYLDTKGIPKYLLKLEETGDIRKLDVPSANLNGEARADLRDAAYRKYLRLPERSEHVGIYVDNPDGETVSYGIDKVNEIRRKHNSGDVPTNYDFSKTNNRGLRPDYITSNGGWVNRVVDKDGVVYMEDVWDINPLKDTKRTISPWITKNLPWIKDAEASVLLNSKPFKLKHKIK